MTEEKKRVNFAPEEQDLLLALVSKEPDLTCMKTDGRTVGLKKAAWKRITEKYNATPSKQTTRTEKQLIKCWNNIKTRYKDQLAVNKRQTMQTGGGVIETTVEENPNIEMVLENVHCELRGAMDSDTVSLQNTVQTVPKHSQLENKQKNYEPPASSYFVEELLAEEQEQIKLEDMQYELVPEETSFSNGELSHNDIVYENGDDYHTTGISPETDDHAGCLNFQLLLDDNEKTKKPWLYSSKLKKLFIDINKVVCVEFQLLETKSIKVNSREQQLFIRALPVYTAPEFLQEPVTRCPTHVKIDVEHIGHENVPWIKHVLRAVNPQAVYHFNRKSNRHSVVVPLNMATLGSQFIMYKFTCKTSCVFGLNRRAVDVVFTLENARGKVLGRRKLPVKVCSNLKRDSKQEENTSLSKGDTKSRKIRITEVNSLEMNSPATEHLTHLSEEESGVDHESYTIPSFTVTGKKQYISTLEVLAGHFAELARNDAVDGLNRNINTISELLNAYKN